MDNKGFFKAKRMSDGTEIIGYLIKNHPFTFIITPEASERMMCDGRNQCEITVEAIRVLEKSVEKVD